VDMKPFSANRKTLSRAKARNATLVNLFATPGLGSLMCGRWLEGLGQLFLALAGCALILIWFFKIIFRYYGLMFSDESMPSPNVGWIGGAGGILLAVSWLWSLVTSLRLMHEATNEKLVELKSFAAKARILNPAEIAIALAKIPNWQRNDNVISRIFQFKDFVAAMQFVNAVAEIAETAAHHPDIDIRWNKVTLALTTHDAGGLTEKDFALAGKFDGLALH